MSLFYTELTNRGKTALGPLWTQYNKEEKDKLAKCVKLKKKHKHVIVEIPTF